MALGSLGVEFLLTSLVYYAPMLVVLFVGMAMAAARLRRQRKPAVMALIALALMFVDVLVGLTVQAVLLEMSQGAPAAGFRYLEAVGTARVALHAGALLLLVLSVFAGRSAPPDPE